MKSIWDLPNKWIVASIAIVVSFVFIAIMTLVFKNSDIGIVMLDYSNKLPYPFTIQNLMYVIFFFGLGELFVRWRIAVREHAFIAKKYLPEDAHTILQIRQLGEIKKAVANDFDGEHGFIPSLINMCILQFFSSKSISQSVSVLNSRLDLLSHSLDLRYAMLRFITWVIPTFGFIGTVTGISQTLMGIDPENIQMKMLTKSLGVAFNTTLISLLLSAILVFLLHLIQTKEEKTLNNAGTYVLQNLINRLYVEKGKNI